MLYTIHKRTLKRIVVELTKLANGEVYDPNGGICINLDPLEFLPMGPGCLVSHLAKTWEHFSGNAVYPVPHPTLSAAEGYNLAESLWEGEYGRSRKELCLFMAQQIAEHLEKS